MIYLRRFGGNDFLATIVEKQIIEVLYVTPRISNPRSLSCNIAFEDNKTVMRW
jgi:hypothetical protein